MLNRFALFFASLFLGLVISASAMQSHFSVIAGKRGYTRLLLAGTLSEQKDTYFDYKIGYKLGWINKQGFRLIPYISYITIKNFGNVPVYVRFGRQFLENQNLIINNADYGYDGIVAELFYKFVKTDVVYLKQAEGLYEGTVGHYSLGEDKTIYGFWGSAGDFERERLGGIFYYKQTDKDSDIVKSYLGLSLLAKIALVERATLGLEAGGAYSFGTRRASDINDAEFRKYRGFGVWAELSYKYAYPQKGIKVDVFLGYQGRGLLSLKSDSYIVEFSSMFYSESHSVYRNRLNGYTTEEFVRGNEFYAGLDLKYRAVGLTSKIAFFTEQTTSADVFLGINIYIKKHLKLLAGFGNYFAQELKIYSRTSVQYDF